MNPGTMKDPDENTVCTWLHENRGESYPAAARHFFPGAPPSKHDALARKYARWWKRWATARGVPLKRETPDKGTPVKGTLRGHPRWDLADMDPHERLAWELAELGADLEVARAKGEGVAVAQLDKRFLEVGKALDDAKDRAARLGKGIDRTPIGVQTAIAEREPLLAALAEVRKRNEQRAKAHERAAKKGKTL